MPGSFQATSTTEDVLGGVDLGGKHILVTGVSAGLGVETARALVAHGAKVTGAARNLEKAEAATAPVRAAAAVGNGAFTLVELDLASLKSVRACADALADTAFDVIIANAGVMAPPFGRTEDGFETQMGTNHFGHFVLINRLAPNMPEGGRVVVLASSAHHMGDMDLDDPDYRTTEYDVRAGYGRSKTANILFITEFDRRHRDRGIRAAAVHPGAIETELGRHLPEELRRKQMEKLKEGVEGFGMDYLQKNVGQGAATSVWAAVVAPADEVGGRYCEDCGVAEVLPPGTKTGPLGPGVASYAVDPERARIFWEKTEELVGETF
ncbi:SDR family NAD(P)-dependent oxidoreductase [Stakelama tenebrarum]|uniref:SDR family NAD(P)-dependent oxidoreductase n=1 Tax=Stakelama tenebrarum TaxID=2711215 RepID=A0A6G6Y7B4_9SPHN|nr:SDR family NAD(P)-dependent oxidoreductase [Sphingosinithalassobacter tenebrarum]QIG80741.1 SDR family NAD(P)-dependent oxidoreductase [Sphingosinithalassobacter tenebrarum]